jgi:predicted ester cyclase
MNEESAMGTDADIVRRLTDEAFIGGKTALIDELGADNYVDHDPPPGFSADRDGFRQLAEMVVGAFSDRKVEFDEYVEGADGRIVESWAMTGKHSAEAFGVPPSNQPIRVRGIEIWRCSDGKVVEHWGAVDMSDVFEKAAAG